jgi:hypothetical protein
MAERWRRVLSTIRSARFDRVLVPVFFTAFALARAGRFEERDPYWQARAGLENLAGAPLARPDTWTWSGIEGLWYQNSPGWNTIVGLSYQVGGYWGLYVVAAATLLGYFAVAYALALRLGARGLPALAGIMAAASPAISMLSPRATLLVQILILLSFLVALALADGWGRRLPIPAAALVTGLCAAALSAAGNAAHLSFIAFSPLLGGAWVLLWWVSRLSLSRKLALSMASAVGWAAGLVATPYGLAMGLERTRVVQQVCDGLILEWTTPFQAEISPVFWIMAAAATVYAAVVTVVFVRGWVRPPWDSSRAGYALVLAISVPTAVAGWFAIRFLGVSLLSIAPALAVVATMGVDRLRQRYQTRPAGRWWEYRTGGFWRVALSATLVLLAPAVGYLVSRHAVPDEQAIVDRLPAGCRLLSSGGLSASVELTRPDVSVWIDGRADFFGRDQLLRAYSVFGLTAPTLVPEGTQCVLLDVESKDSVGLAAAIEASGQWRVVASDGRFRIWIPA